MSIAQKAYDLIRGEILTCSLAPGQQIVQARLVEKFGLGMTPIREALLRLAHEGLVQPYPRFGYIVSPVTEEMVRHLYEVRMILETAAVRLAVERASDAQLRQVAESARFTYVYKNHEQYVRFLERNAAFHDSIAMLAGNPRLADMLGGFSMNCRASFISGWTCATAPRRCSLSIPTWPRRCWPGTRTAPGRWCGHRSAAHSSASSKPCTAGRNRSTYINAYDAFQSKNACSYRQLSLGLFIWRTHDC